MSRRAPGTNRTSHRPKRDNQRGRETADLKQENHQLKRAVARLRKQLDQMQCLTDEPDEPSKETPQYKEQQRRCPSCRSEVLTHVPLPSGRTLSGCRSCQWRSD